MMSAAYRTLYRLLGPRWLAVVDQARYRLNLLPRVADACRCPASAVYPQPHRACLVISADFELAWGWRHTMDESGQPTVAMRCAEQGRRNFPRLLALFDRYDVPITWATVGHLFLEHCEAGGGTAHPGAQQHRHPTGGPLPRSGGESLDGYLCGHNQVESAWCAPDLIRAILQAKAGHEIACHTFAHINCAGGRCAPAVMNSELAECQWIADKWGLKLTSLAFPWNAMGNLESLKQHGFTAYRGHGRYDSDVPRMDEFGLWQIPGGPCWEKPKGWPTDAWIGAMRRCVDRAIAVGAALHLWFHPCCDPINVETIFPATLGYVAAHRAELWVTTMAGLAGWLATIPKAQVAPDATAVCSDRVA